LHPASAINHPPYAVITADVIGSQKWSRFTAIRNRKLVAASIAHQKQRIVLGPYTITTWDEFQNIACELRHVPGMIFDLRRLFHPLQDLANLFFGLQDGLRRHLVKTMEHHQRTHGGSKPGYRRRQVGRRQIHRLKKPAARTLLADPGFHRSHGRSGRHIARKHAT
jgi:hypothetical protein